jgi:hypothetical protein
MDKAELLSKFNGQVDLFEKYQTFIEKAQSQSGRFSAAVVERVVADNRAKSSDIIGEIVSMMAELDTVVTNLEAEREEVTRGAADSQLLLEELELRHMIGELADDDFEAESAEVKSVVETADTKVGSIDAELGEFKAASERWTELGTRSGMVDVVADSDAEADVESESESEADVESESESESESEADVESESESDAEEDAEPNDVAEEGADAEADAAPDVDGEAGPEESSDEDQAVLDIDIDDAGESELDLGADDGDAGFEVGDLDILGEDEELDLDGGDAVVETDQQEKPRRAVLLYQEGTAEEQIYPFSGEVLSLGRGRDNDVQVKNDSKVSRYHCKLYRRGPNFYIEDNKSANGTLVNGELITERRLFGGEEVIIGETFFRFRILE